jgi:hypothetical protein
MIYRRADLSAEISIDGLRHARQESSTDVRLDTDGGK